MIRAQICKVRKDFSTWSTDDVIEWICSVEQGHFNRYRKSITKQCILQGINGNTLEDLTQSELQCLGISNVQDRVLLWQEMQELEEDHPSLKALMSILIKVSDVTGIFICMVYIYESYRVQ